MLAMDAQIFVRPFSYEHKRYADEHQNKTIP